jgi:hypothetical protein
MLQSEFFERTHITLTCEEYADVECLYNAVKMDKDEFCKRWVSEKKNPLFKELAEAYCHEHRMHISDVNQLQSVSKSLREELDATKERMQKESDERLMIADNHFLSFAKDLVVKGSNGGLCNVFDAIEEEFGYPFIIKTKHEAGIALSEREIEYMVGKL